MAGVQVGSAMLALTLAFPVSVQTVAVPDLLDAYHLRRHDYVESHLTTRLSTHTELQRFLRELRDNKSRISASGFASFAVEAAAIAAKTDPQAAREILELGCARLRQGVTVESYLRLWNVAAIAAISGPLNDEYRAGWGRVHSVFASASWERHFDHIPKAIRDAPEVVFAWGISRQAVVHTWDLSWGQGAKADGVRSETAQALRAFERGRTSPPLAAEASLRIGWLEARTKQYDRALQRWQGLDRPETSEAVRYIALVLIGRVYLEQGRAALAVEPFTQASRLQPSSGHAAWLGRRIAQTLIGVTPTAGDHAPVAPNLDPWLRFFDSYGGLERDRRAAIIAVREQSQ